jgi:hypothetical protein
MCNKKRLSDDESENRVPQKLHALVIAGVGGIFPALVSELIGQRTVRERVHQQIGVAERMPQHGFEFSECCFHMRLAREGVYGR